MLVRVVEEVSFPARRDDLVRAAKKLDAPQGLVNALQALPDETFEDPDRLKTRVGARW